MCSRHTERTQKSFFSIAAVVGNGFVQGVKVNSAATLWVQIIQLMMNCVTSSNTFSLSGPHL